MFFNLWLRAVFFLLPWASALSHAIDNSEKITAITRFLNNQSKIRIVIESTAHGFGHQSSNIRLMKRLRELGFKGVFEIYLDHRFDNDKKMIPLIAGYSNKGLGKQEIKNKELGAIEVITVSNVEKDTPNTKNPLTFMGAFDGSLDSKIFASKNFILLQPMQWLGARIAVYDNEHVFLQEAEPLIHHLGIVTNSDSSSTKEQFFKRGLKQLSSNPSNGAQNKLDSLKWLDGLLSRFTVLTTYSTVSEDNSYNLFDKSIEALRGIREDGSKPILILSLDNFSQMQNSQTEILCRSKGASYIDLEQHLSRKKRKEWLKSLSAINFVQVGSVPPDIFYSLLLKSDLPPYIEGQNSKDFMFRRGLPFLNTSGNLDIDYRARTLLVDPILRYDPIPVPDWVRRFDDVFFRSNARDEDIKLLKNFYRRSLARDPEIYDEFKKFAQPALDYHNDPVSMGLWEYMKLSGDADRYKSPKIGAFSALCRSILARLSSRFRAQNP